MAEQTITLRGSSDLGDCVLVDDAWYIRRTSWWIDGDDAEDGWDIQIETGYYSKLELPTSPEDIAFVEAFVAEKERKEAERAKKLYQENYTSLFIPEVGQRVTFRFAKKSGTIIEISKHHTVRVRKDGDKNPLWISPYYLDLEGVERPQGELHFYDLNEVK